MADLFIQPTFICQLLKKSKFVKHFPARFSHCMVNQTHMHMHCREFSHTSLTEIKPWVVIILLNVQKGYPCYPHRECMIPYRYCILSLLWSVYYNALSCAVFWCGVHCTSCKYSDRDGMFRFGHVVIPAVCTVYHTGSHTVEQIKKNLWSFMR